MTDREMTGRENAHGAWRRVILQGILPIRKGKIFGDVIAGATLASLAVPEVLGYATIAGMPVITGLYTLLVPVVVFAVLGSSRHLVVGADSATAAIMATALAGMAAAGSDHYVALAQMLALLTGTLLLLARLIDLGFLADFLSRSVLIGFLTGVGVQVALSQIPDLLGIEGGTGGIVSKLGHALEHLDATNSMTLAVSIGMIMVIAGAKYISPRIPAPLFAVISAIVISWGLNLKSQGVSVVGSIPAGLPNFQLPQLGFSFHLVLQLLPTAATMCVVILAQSAATSRAYAARYQEDGFDENNDLLGLSIANLGAGLSGTFVVNGSPTKTAMADSAGASSQLAQLTASVVVLAVLLFLTTPLEHLPTAALASVVFLIGVDLIDIRGMRALFHQARSEFWVAALTAAVVVFVGVEQGIALAVVLSLIDHTRRGYRPKNLIIVRRPGGGWLSRQVSEPEELAPGLMVYHFSHSLYYANTQLFSNETAALTRGARPRLRWFCLDMISIDSVDYTGGQEIVALQKRLAAKNIRLVFVMVSNQVKEALKRYGIADQVGHSAFFQSIDELTEAFPPLATKNGGGDSKGGGDA